jgi:hypothetical protein
MNIAWGSIAKSYGVNTSDSQHNFILRVNFSLFNSIPFLRSLMQQNVTILF